MTDAVLIAAFAAVPGLAMGLGTIFQVRRVHVLVNSQKDALTRLLREALVTIDTLEKTQRRQIDEIDGLRRRLQHTQQETLVLDACPLLHTNVPPEEAR